MKIPSAGTLLFRRSGPDIEVFLGHLGGPFYAKRDEGFWGIPKGRFEEGEDAIAAAYREFEEEIGAAVPEGEAIELTSVPRKGDGMIHVWAVEDTQGVEFVKSNLCEIEWPPRSGKIIEIPEIDRAEWFTLPVAREKIHKVQLPFLDELEARLRNG